MPKPKTFSNGVLFANSDFSSITYLPRGGWDGEDGLMFAGPAITREQALIISNEVMKKFIKNSRYWRWSLCLKLTDGHLNRLPLFIEVTGSLVTKCGILLGN